MPDELRDVAHERLKHGTGKFSHIVLVPQPSDSPNDPLNVSAMLEDPLRVKKANRAIVAHMEEGCHSLPGGHVCCSGRCLRTHAGTWVCANLGATRHHSRRTVAVYRMVNPVLGPLRLLHEPSREDLREAPDLHLR